MKSQKLYWYDLFNRRASRRDFLRVSGNVAGLIALGTLPACQTDRAPRFRSNPFTLGVASGDPIPDGVVLWTRLARQTLSEAGIPDRAVPTAWEIAQDEGFQRIVQSGSTLAVPELGHSVHTRGGGPGAGTNILVSVQCRRRSKSGGPHANRSCGRCFTRALSFRIRVVPAV